MRRRKSGKRDRRFKRRRHFVGSTDPGMTFYRNLSRLARRARSTQERVDTQDAIATHNRRGDITNEEAELLLELMRR